MRTLLLVTLLAQALVAGTFFAFSTFVMPAFARIPPESAVRAMRQINETILASAFMVAFMGSAALEIGLPIANRIWGDASRTLGYAIAGALYVIGVFGITVIGNVPLNDALKATAHPAEAAWREYAGPWALWNHARTLFGLAAISVLVWTATRHEA